MFLLPLIRCFSHWLSISSDFLLQLTMNFSWFSVSYPYWLCFSKDFLSFIHYILPTWVEDECSETSGALLECSLRKQQIPYSRWVFGIAMFWQTSVKAKVTEFSQLLLLKNANAPRRRFENILFLTTNWACTLILRLNIRLILYSEFEVFTP